LLGSDPSTAIKLPISSELFLIVAASTQTQRAISLMVVSTTFSIPTIALIRLEVG
jgi:hypothetical protein